MKGPSIKVLLLVLASVVVSAFAMSVGALLDNYQVIKTNESAEASAKAAVSSAEGYDFADGLRESTVEKVIAENSIPAYTYAQVASMDMSKPSGVTKDELALVTQKGLTGLEDAFYNAEQDNDINALFVMGIAAHESAYGTICFKPNNMFGFGTTGFSSKAECVKTVAHALATNYLNGGKYSTGTSNTIDSVNRRYAADGSWDKKVAKKVVSFYATISAARTKQLNKLK